MTQQTTQIHRGKRPIRIHYIREWTRKRNLRQADLVRELGVDKSTVSRWFAGSLPSEQHLIALAGFFETEVPGLFRDPDDDWLARLLRGKSAEQRAQAVNVLNAMFGSERRTGTDG